MRTVRREGVDHIEVHVFVDDDPSSFEEVSVYKWQMREGQPWNPAYISWGVYGSVNPDRAELHAQAVAEAAKIARALDEEKGA